EPARDHDAGARLAHAARGAGPAHALRHRHEHRPYTGRGRPAVLGDARAHPPDRGQGAAQAQASVAVTDAQKLPGALKSREPAGAEDMDCARYLWSEGLVFPPFLLKSDTGLPEWSFNSCFAYIWRCPPPTPA